MGEIASQFDSIAADDPVLEPIFALAEEFDVPTLIHSHGTGGPAPQFRIEIGRPTRIEEVLIRHPALRISIEASGFPFLEGTIALMLRYPNVYGDLSTWKYTREIFEWYLRRLLGCRTGESVDVRIRCSLVVHRQCTLQSISSHPAVHGGPEATNTSDPMPSSER